VLFHWSRHHVAQEILSNTEVLGFGKAEINGNFPTESTQGPLAFM